ncbi:hypothetical protein Vi05172_g4202 [Venturia inaequalis]|nr:hypothetical protein Vi05172_g4202 [Venturia inaequalis]
MEAKMDIHAIMNEMEKREEKERRKRKNRGKERDGK